MITSYVSLFQLYHHITCVTVSVISSHHMCYSFSYIITSHVLLFQLYHHITCVTLSIISSHYIESLSPLHHHITLSHSSTVRHSAVLSSRQSNRGTDRKMVNEKNHNWLRGCLCDQQKITKTKTKNTNKKAKN